MNNKQVSREKAKKTNVLISTFYIKFKKYTFCIMGWLVNVNGKLKNCIKNYKQSLLLDTKLYELFNNKLIIHSKCI